MQQHIAEKKVRKDWFNMHTQKGQQASHNNQPKWMQNHFAVKTRESLFGLPPFPKFAFIGYLPPCLPNPSRYPKLIRRTREEKLSIFHSPESKFGFIIKKLKITTKLVCQWQVKLNTHHGKQLFIFNSASCCYLAASQI